MSLIPTDSGASTSELPAMLKRWMTCQEEMAALNNELKQRKTQSKALKDVILRIMESNRVVQLNVSKGTVLHKTREVTERITNEYLLKHCKDFFNGDMERAKLLVTYLEEHRSTVTKHDLKLNVTRGDDDRLSHSS
jgi:hypothetical protein